MRNSGAVGREARAQLVRKRRGAIPGCFGQKLKGFRYHETENATFNLLKKTFFG
jgi:hypothetical protein